MYIDGNLRPAEKLSCGAFGISGRVAACSYDAPPRWYALLQVRTRRFIASRAWCRSNSSSSRPGAREESARAGGRPRELRAPDRRLNTGPQGNQYAGRWLGDMRVAGAAITPMALPKQLLPVADLGGAVTVAARSCSPRPPTETRSSSNGRNSTPPTDTRRQLGAVEEWTIRMSPDERTTSTSNQRLQVTEVNGVPAAVRRLPGTSSTCRSAEPVKGHHPVHGSGHRRRFVYHCHLLGARGQGDDGERSR